MENTAIRSSRLRSGGEHCHQELAGNNNAETTTNWLKFCGGSEKENQERFGTDSVAVPQRFWMGKHMVYGTNTI